MVLVTFAETKVTRRKGEILLFGLFDILTTVTTKYL